MKDGGLITPDMYIPNNLTTTFSGIGYVAIDVNALVLCAIERYSLNVRQLPFYTVLLHFNYIVENLKVSSLKDMRFFYEESGDAYIDHMIRMLDDGGFCEFSEINFCTRNDRIGFVFTCLKREGLIKFCHDAGLYVVLQEHAYFEFPYMHSLILKPSLRYISDSIYSGEILDKLATLNIKENRKEESIIDSANINSNIESILNKWFGVNSLEELTNKSYVSGCELSFVKSEDVISKERLDILFNLWKNGCSMKFDGRIFMGLYNQVSECNDEGSFNFKVEPIASAKDFKDASPWLGGDLDLIMPPVPAKPNLRHLANIRRSALSMFEESCQYSMVSGGEPKEERKVSDKVRQIIAQNSARIFEERRRKDNEWLENFYGAYSRLNGLSAKKKFIEGIRLKNDYINNKLLLLKIELYEQFWELEKKKESPDEHVLIPLYLACLNYIEIRCVKNENLSIEIGKKVKEEGEEEKADKTKEKNKRNKSKKSGTNNGKDTSNSKNPDRVNREFIAELEFVLGCLVNAGFEATVREIVERYELPVNIHYRTNGTSMPNDIDLYFQLKFVGEHLKRTLGTRKDRRVPFDPDQWQVDLLDAVDANKSAVVAAPTSSGKTFVCFYAIEKILKNSDTDVVVFCLPTKALANQVSADIYARFTPKNCRMALQGTLMNDKCTEPFTCQVLITIPGMLESLLNDTSRRETLEYEYSSDSKKENDNESYPNKSSDEYESSESSSSSDDALSNQEDLTGLNEYNSNNTSMKNNSKERSDDIKNVNNNIKIKNTSNSMKNNSKERNKDIKNTDNNIKTKNNRNSKGSRNNNMMNIDRIKYIIIDEVHKINDPTIGLSIERIIHLAKCPLLLLSATIGNLDVFYGWFRDIEASKGRETLIITHNERYCELKPYVWKGCDGTDNLDKPMDNTSDNDCRSNLTDNSNNSGISSDIKNLSAKNKLIPLNCMFAYSFTYLKEFGFSNDINFLPEELLNLYYYIYIVLRPEQKKKIKKLAPKNFFKSNIISKAEVKQYELHLLRTFESWLRKGLLGEDQVREVYRLLVGDTFNSFPEVYDESFLMSNLLPLLLLLRDKDMMPVIVFNTDRELVTRMARFVWQELEKMDIRKKKDKFAEKMRKETKRNRDNEKTKNSWIEESIAMEQHIDTDTRDIRFTFLDPLTKLTDVEVREELGDVRKTPKYVLDMVYRGIGIHHAGMERKYRSAIEILFRKKHVRVIFATETLALGINMPCRTVVFAGDSLELDPMNYKQMAGRAGRRGYDTLGNVVYFGIPKNRVQNLMVSKLPEIKGLYSFCNSSLVSFNITDSLVRHSLLGRTCAEELFGGHSDKEAGNQMAEVKDNQMAEVKDNQMAEVKDNQMAAKTEGKACKTINGRYTWFAEGFADEKKRSELIKFQKEYLTSIFPSTYLWDLYISNRGQDNAVFVFGMLIHYGEINFDPEPFIITLAHLFEVRPCLPTYHSILPPLPTNTANFLLRINRSYKDVINHFYSPELRTLASATDSPLYYIKSFIYTLDVPKNNYIYEFFKHGSAQRIFLRNGIQCGDLWLALFNIDNLITSLIKLFTTYDSKKRIDDLKKLKRIYEIFDKKFKAIFS